MTRTICLALMLLFPVAAVHAADSAHRAARSVHLWYPAPEAQIYYNEVTVHESQNGTYFCAAGFGHGYFGIQQLGAPDDKVVIFSVWDPGKQDDPNTVAEDRRVKVLFQGEDVRIKRFGGEGTGGQSFFSYPWKIGQTCRFLVRTTVDGRHTAFAAYFYLHDKRQWKHLATFQTLTGGEHLKGLYSFVEDFRRDGVSPGEARSASYGNGWVQTVDGNLWISLTRARFTADRNPLDNINALVRDNAFVLATGGQTQNTTPLNATLTRPPAGMDLPDFEE